MIDYSNWKIVQVPNSKRWQLVDDFDNVILSYYSKRVVKSRFNFIKKYGKR